MKKYVAIFFTFYILGCSTEPSFDDSIIYNRTYKGTFKITYINDLYGNYIESGNIQITFFDTTYNYKAFLNDTTSGRGRFFKNGLSDRGNYSKQSNALQMQDKATTIYVANPIGAASLYMNGAFKIVQNNSQIILTNSSNFKKYIIELEE